MDDLIEAIALSALLVIPLLVLGGLILLLIKWFP